MRYSGAHISSRTLIMCVHFAVLNAFLTARIFSGQYFFGPPFPLLPLTALSHYRWPLLMRQRWIFFYKSILSLWYLICRLRGLLTPSSFVLYFHILYLLCRHTQKSVRWRFLRWFLWSSRKHFFSYIYKRCCWANHLRT